MSVEPKMADFSLTRGGSVIDSPIDYQAASDPAAQRDIADRIVTLPGTTPGFTEGSYIRIVLDDNRHADQLAEPTCQIEFRPPFDLVGTTDPPRSPIYGPSKTHPDSSDGLAGNQRGQRLLHLLANPNGPSHRLDNKLAPDPYPQRFIRQDHLQLGAANLYAEIIHNAGVLSAEASTTR